MVTQQLWIAFVLLVSILLAIDLGLFHRRPHALSLREAAMWTATWITLALCFGVGVYFHLGKDPAIQFLSGYLVEYSLSMDNVFLFAVIFRHFRVPPKYQRRVLSWGIITAVALRGVMIALGAELVERFHWVNYLFGGFLLFTAIRMLRQHEEETDLNKSKILHWLRRNMRVLNRYEGSNFFTKHEGKWHVTLLFLVLVFIEITDVLFAVDSIPAIFGITKDTFIVFTSNILAILGLRSLYFLLAGVMDLFYYLPVGLAVILGFVGGVMVLETANWVNISALGSLVFIIATMGISIAASIARKKRQPVQVEAGVAPTEPEQVE
ncbi:MAG: TerC family protein [Armatimonadetes bacterium]|nr:TerC family protein [Armatimonadota bacterium]